MASRNAAPPWAIDTSKGPPRQGRQRPRTHPVLSIPEYLSPKNLSAAPDPCPGDRKMCEVSEAGPRNAHHPASGCLPTAACIGLPHRVTPRSVQTLPTAPAYTPPEKSWVSSTN